MWPDARSAAGLAPGARGRPFSVLISLLLVALLSSRESIADNAYRRLLASVGEDPSFKVRMQAIRVLVKQLKGSGEKPDDEVIRALGRAATSDEEYLVRGLAAFALGELKDLRAKGTLATALGDPHPFVRAQAEEALKAIKGAEKPTAVARRRALSVLAESTPGVQVEEELRGELKTLLDAEFRAQAGDQFAVGDGGDGAGFRMNGSIAEMTVASTEDGGQRVTIVVRVTIMTLPENYLRHVMTAKASAVSRATGHALVSLEKKVLRAAVVRVVKDSIAQVAEE